MKTRILSLFVFFASSYTGGAQAADLQFEADDTLPLVYLNVVVRGGAVEDPAGKSGLTNFMGEMLLRGTKIRSKEQLDQELDQMGAHFEEETRSEAVVFRGAVLSHQLERFLPLVNEILTQPAFPESELRKLKGELISALLEEQGRDQSLAGRHFDEFLFSAHPYGKSVMGKLKDLESLTSQDVRRQYESQIRDGRITILASGDSSALSRLQAWSKTLEKSRPGKEDAPRVVAPKPVAGRRLVIVDKPERTQTQILGGEIGFKMNEPDFFDFYVANFVFGGGSFQARLMSEIRTKRGWSYGANSAVKFSRQPRSWRFYLFPAAKDTAAALETVLKMVEEWRDRGVTPQELDFAKTSLINGAGFLLNTPRKRIENRIQEITLDLPEGFMKHYAEGVARVTLESANASVKAHIHPDQLSILALGTAKDLKEPLAKSAGVPIDKVQVIDYRQD